MNNLLCEPNRFFQAYNLGHYIFCFEHPSLTEFYDDNIFVIDPCDFERSLFNQLNNLITIAQNSLTTKSGGSKRRKGIRRRM